MKHIHCLMIVALIIAALQLSACGRSAAGTESENEPAKIEPIAGTKLSSVTLTEEAVKRLGLEQVPVRDAQVNGKQRKVIPYAAVLYDPDGATWAFTNPKPLFFVRQAIKVDYIAADQAILLEGPPTGTAVVTVGAAELFGAEIGVGE
jgi:hypothetical protein